jgi:hypothetical protein
MYNMKNYGDTSNLEQLFLLLRTPGRRKNLTDSADRPCGLYFQFPLGCSALPTSRPMLLPWSLALLLGKVHSPSNTGGAELI